MTDNETQVIPIHASSKYIVVVSCPESLEIRNIDIIVDSLEAWWESERKFFALVVGEEEGQVKLERIIEDEAK